MKADDISVRALRYRRSFTGYRISIDGLAIDLYAKQALTLQRMLERKKIEEVL